MGRIGELFFGGTASRAPGERGTGLVTLLQNSRPRNACCDGRQSSAIGWRPGRPAPIPATGPRLAANAPATSSNSAAWCRRPGWSNWSTMTAPPCSALSWSWPITCATGRPGPSPRPYGPLATPGPPRLRCRPARPTAAPGCRHQHRQRKPGRVNASTCAVTQTAGRLDAVIREEQPMRNRIFHQARIAGMIFEGIIDGERPCPLLPDERQRGAWGLRSAPSSSPKPSDHAGRRRPAGGS